jgi:glycosyltransferase 2 family protein
MVTKNFFDKLVVFVVVIIIFYVAILIISDINTISDQISNIKLIYLPIIFSLTGFQLIILGIKYHRILKKLGIDISLNESVKIFISGISLIATPGGAGTAIKSHILKKKYATPISKTLPIIFMERLTELIGTLIVLSLFFYWTNLYESLLAIILGFIFSFIMYLLISNNKIFYSLKIFLNKINKIKKLSNSIDDSKESFLILRKKNIFLEMIGWSFIAKLSYFFAIYFIFISLDVDLGFLLSGQIYHTSLVLGSLSFLPSGIIITESTMIAILLNHGVDFSLATLLVIFTRLVTTWTSTLLGIITLKIIQNK